MTALNNGSTRATWRVVGRVAVAWMALLAGGSAAAQGAVERRRPPNIVYILADDLGYGEVGSFGQRRINTPRLDRMAREGMRLTHHYAGSAVCAPSRSALMTGLHTGHTTVRNNSGRNPADPEGRVPLRHEDLTVAELLRGTGYTTGLIGKWGLGEPGTSGVPNAQGFDYFYGYLNQNHAALHFTDYLWRNGERVPLEGNRDGGRKQYTQDAFTEEALTFLERNREKPFFLYLAYVLPHVELAVPEGDSLLAVYERSLPKPEATFAAMVSRLDRDVGRVLDRLEELGLDRNTLVIFTSDNGPHTGKDRDLEHFDGNGPLRGMKGDLYEGGIRVPTIAWWPGRVAAGSSSAHISAFWDFLPTAAELAGVAAPRHTDGISYLPALLGRPQRAHEFLYWEFFKKDGAQQAVRLGRWKALKLAPKGPVELYDLQLDPGETRNVAAANPEMVRRAAVLFRREHTPSPWYPSPLSRAGRTPKAHAFGSGGDDR